MSAPDDEAPVHLIAYSRAPLTMCGRKRYLGEALPAVLLRWWPMHRLGHDPPLCAECRRESEP